MIDTTLISYAISELPLVVFTRWGICLLVSILFYIALKKQNRQYRQLLQESQQDDTKQAFYQSAKARGNVALILWLLLVGLLIYRDIEKEIDKSRNYPESTTISAAEDFSYQEVNVDPASSPSDEPVKEDRDYAIDRIKTAYEEAFISYIILKRCQQEKSGDYERLYTALYQALAVYNEPKETADSVMEAAKGSYQSLYANTACSDTYLAPIKKSLANFLQKAEQN